MTSGNLSEEPIAKDNAEAVERLSCIADAFLMHDRPIRTRCDDSVVRVYNTERRSPRPEIASITTGLSRNEFKKVSEPLFWMPIRRSRGYVPYPILLTGQYPTILAVGGELKNVFCLTRGNYAFLSHHIGDLENFETLKAFEDGIRHFESLFNAAPETLAYDLHPNYLAARYALDRAASERIPAIGVQHHHAHVAACLADNNYLRDDYVLGVAFDGTGYGDDGMVWGGEFLLANYRDYKRVAHLVYTPLLGGEKAIKEPWRMALVWLAHSGISWDEDLPPVKFARQRKPGGSLDIDLLEVLHNQLTLRINSPLTSSAGRLFDAVASLIGVRHTANYEAQAAIELEAEADRNVTSSYSFEISTQLPRKSGDESFHMIDPAPMFKEIVADLKAGLGQKVIAGKFHNTVVNLIAETCETIRTKYGVQDVFLSGGVWQNALLLTRIVPFLEERGFRVYTHRQVPSNDGGLALGQAAVAAHRVK
jgi:hydrogenase maturation protein HypF